MSEVERAKGYIHGSTDPREVARLEKQAGFAWRFVGPKFIAHKGERVLDLATGVGAMAEQILMHHPGVRLFGADVRMSQLRSAKANHPGVTLVNADGARLPFKDAVFDRIHCSWLLEHVPNPVAILRECRRVTRPGGTVHFVEVDNATFRLVPPDPEIEAVMDALNRAQTASGGDPFVGQKLGALFREAGFEQVSLSPSALHGRWDDPAFYAECITEFAEIFESIDEAVDPEMAQRAHAAAQKLRARLGMRGSEFHYSGVLAVATR
ncbi:MAG: methyltransferase domain-containing protein [Myxococcaceae bacterium]|nr:methyltransferase domain-containing protein [Myxococcaceae bacterium]